MLGGLFGSKPVDPSTVTASAAQKTHGPYSLQIKVDEGIINGKRIVTPTLFVKTSQGEVEGLNIDEFLDDIADSYESRLKEKNAANATARNKAITANTAAKKAKAEAEAKAAQDKVDAEEKAKILKYLKERRITPTTTLLSKKISDEDKTRYEIEKHRNETVKPAGPKPLAGPPTGPAGPTGPIAPPPQSGGRTRKNRNRKNRSRKNRY